MEPNEPETFVVQRYFLAHFEPKRDVRWGTFAWEGLRERSIKTSVKLKKSKLNALEASNFIDITHFAEAVKVSAESTQVKSIP
jgi:hypothetical protein